eukprot:14741936-Heterocapsa_arctica.AAC.1
MPRTTGPVADARAIANTDDAAHELRAQASTQRGGRTGRRHREELRGSWTRAHISRPTEKSLAGGWRLAASR